MVDRVGLSDLMEKREVAAFIVLSTSSDLALSRARLSSFGNKGLGRIHVFLEPMREKYTIYPEPKGCYGTRKYGKTSVREGEDNL